jgi:hypothetical protein
MQGSKLKGALKSRHALNLKHIIKSIKTIKTFISLLANLLLTYYTLDCFK